MDRVEVNKVAKVDFAFVELLAPDVNGLEGERALAKSYKHRLAAGLDTFGYGGLACARKQFHRAHIAKIHAHGIVRALGGVATLVLDGNRS